MLCEYTYESDSGSLILNNNSLIRELVWKPELVSSFWAGVAKSRLDELSFGKMGGAAFVDFIVPFLPSNATILDFGAGSGHLIELLCNKGFQVAGFELSEGRKENIKEKLIGNKNFLGFSEIGSKEKFDVVILTEVIEHILEDDFDKALQAICNFVKPGGYLIVTTPHNEDLELNHAYCVLSNTFFHRWQHVKSFVPEDVENAFIPYGMERVRLGLVDFSADVNMIEEYKKIKNRLNKVELQMQELLKDLESLDDLKVFGIVKIFVWLKVWLTSWLEKPYGVKKIFIKNIEFETLALLEEMVEMFIPTMAVCNSNAQKINSSPDLLKECEQNGENFRKRVAALKEKLKELPKYSQNYGNSNYDFSIGHENTILYIGKKSISEV